MKSSTSKRVLLQSHQQQQQEQEDPSSSSLFVYQTPLQLPLKDELSTNMSIQCLTVMFNLALAFHVQGMMLANNQSQQKQHGDLLRNSIQMYELCYEMMSTEYNLNPGIYFIMSLTNNLGCAHATLGGDDNIYKSHKCFYHLLSMQMYVTDSMELETTEVGGHGAGTGSTTATNDTQNVKDGDDNDDDNGNIAMDILDEPSPESSMLLSSPFDGFLHNTSRFILHDNCASAA